MSYIEELKDRVLTADHRVTAGEALRLCGCPLDELCRAANEIREKVCGSGFDLCAIINGKSGRCSEDCKYCAQSAFYHTATEQYPLLPVSEMVRQAQYNEERGILRYSIVTSGKCLAADEVEQVCAAVRAIRDVCHISVCVSLGLLDETAFSKLKDAGVTRVHNNLETSRRFFPHLCTTHSFDDKIATIHAAQKAGLTVCSGGIMGLGETMEDRIDMALTLRELGIRSIPVNMLTPIPGTPYEHNSKLTNDDMRRIVALYRFILPAASIRLAGGRELLPDQGEACFASGANAAISGDMLTTGGISIAADMQLLKRLGYKPRLCNE